jgi:hypothetical protein
VTRILELHSSACAGAFSIEQLEAGLRTLDSGDTNLNSFWDENIGSFRQTVLLAIRETSDALLAPALSLQWRLEFEGQLEQLVKYLELADRYMTRRQLTRGKVIRLERRYPRDRRAPSR